MDWYEEDVRALESARKSYKFQTQSAAFYGSSTIRLWETLARDLGNAHALNLGFGGSTLEACVYFFERLVVPVCPRSLVVYAGDNDLGDGRSPSEVLEFYRQLTAKVQELLPGALLTFISVKPSPAREDILDRIRTTNRLILREIENSRFGYFIDVFACMLDARGVPRSELFEHDGLHMNHKGYRLWAELLSPHRARIFPSNCSSVKCETVKFASHESRVSSVVQSQPES